MKAICVDFDGVIHEYKTEWQGHTVIPDKPIPGAFEFLTEMVKHFDVNILSTRNEDPDAPEAMRVWFGEFGLAEEVIKKISFPKGKIRATLYIDDRGFHFEGKFPSLEFIKNFKTWHKRDK